MKPVLQALVLADHVYTEKSGKKIICGTFNALRLEPKCTPAEVTASDGTKKRLVKGGEPGAPFAYISLTDVCDGTELELQFVSLSKNQVLFGNRFTIKCSNRLATVEMVLPLPMLPIDGPGTFAFEVVCEGEIIGSLRLVAHPSAQVP